MQVFFTDVASICRGIGILIAKLDYCVWNEPLINDMITLQGVTLPSTHSRCPTGLIPHPQDKQEERTAAKRENKWRTSNKKTVSRGAQQRQKWLNKMQLRCGLSIRGIFLPCPPAVGGEHLPSHSQTTSESTWASGESEFVSVIFTWRPAHACLCFASQVWVQHSPKRGLSWLVHHKPQSGLI